MSYLRRLVAEKIATSSNAVAVQGDDVCDGLKILTRAERTDILRGIGDTFAGMATKDYLKILDIEDFERITAFATAVGTLHLYGRRRDAVVVTLDDRGGRVVNASLQAARYRTAVQRDTLGYAAGMDDDEDGDRSWIEHVIHFATEGLRLRLAEIARSPGLAMPLWPCGDGMHMASLVLYDGRTPFVLSGIASVSDIGTGRLDTLPLERRQRLPADWREILDVDGRRTAAQAYRALEAGL